MRIFITGVAGYLGSTFAYEALKRGFEVFGCDNHSNSDSSSIEKLKKIFSNNFFFENIDLKDFDNLDQYLSSLNNINCIFHFSALKSVPDSEKYPEIYWENNVGGTINLLKSMKKNNIKKIIFSSSASVYGDSLIQPISESFKCIPISQYAKTKKKCEELINNFCSESLGIGCSLRYFNPVGSHNEYYLFENYKKSENLISKIISVAKGYEKKLIIFGDDYNTSDGTGERDYIHVSDLIEGHFKAYHMLEKLDAYSVFNLGTGKSISVLKLIETFEKVNNVKQMCFDAWEPVKNES